MRLVCRKSRATSWSSSVGPAGLLVVLMFLGSPEGFSQETSGRTSPSAEATAAAADDEGSLAERINGIRKLLEADQARLQELEEEREELEREFERANLAFERADKAVADSKRKSAKGEAASVDEVAPPDELVRVRAEARDQFDRVIARRKAVQAQIETLKEKIALEEEALERALKLEEDPPPQAAAAGAEVRMEASNTTPASGLPAKTEQAAAEAEKSKNPPASPLVPLLPTIPAEDAKANATSEPAAKRATRPADQDIVAARRQLQTKQQQLRAEEGGAELLDRSIEVFERDLVNAKQLLEAARSEFEASQKQLAEARQTDPDSEETAGLANRVARLQEELQQQGNQVAESEQLLERLRQRKASLTDRIQQVQSELDSAQRQLWFAESPLAPRRIYTWFAEVGPKWIAILIAMTAAWWAVRIFSKRIAGGLLWKSSRGSDFERQARADTLGRVFQSAGSLAVLVLGILALLQQTGIDVTVLLGGAAVIGAAIAFGSQNLIRDYFSGFMILAENQYSVGNVIRIGDKSGVVEDISLRLTVLRDEEGIVHFIPHNQVTTVSNMTHGWSRAVFAIGVGYQEDVDQIIALLRELALELRKDPDFGPRIIADPEMQGVDAFGESAVVVKFLLKTRPLQQWSVKREMLRRIKKRFDQEGIEIPFPHQTVFYRNLEADEDETDSESPPPAKDGAGRESRR